MKGLLSEVNLDTGELVTLEGERYLINPIEAEKIPSKSESCEKITTFFTLHQSFNV